MAPADLKARSHAAPHVRIPKLAYRIPLPTAAADASNISNISTDTINTLRSTTSTTTTKTTTTTSTDFTTTATRISSLEISATRDLSGSAIASPSRQSFESRSVAPSSLASSNASASSSSRESGNSTDPKKPKKKKTNAVMGFLTLKEPSQTALEQFAIQQRKLAAEKGGQASPTTMSGVSFQKLPANVPKVNSKWDGVPEKVKSKEKRYSTASQATSKISSAPNSSLFSLGSDGSPNPPNSVVSSASSMSELPNPRERRDSGPSFAHLDKSAAPLPEMTYFFPDNPNASGALSDSSPINELPSPSILPESSYNTRRVDDSSTATFTAPPAPRNLPSLHTEVLDRRTLEDYVAAEAAYRLPVSRSAEGEGPASKTTGEERNSDDEHVDAYDFGSHDFLFEDPSTMIKNASLLASDSTPRTTLNFSRPLSTQLATPPTNHVSTPSTTTPRSGVTRLPTLYEASIASTAESINTVVDAADASFPRPSIADSDTSSIAASVDSTTPSEMSASWYQSPRERLGLGSHIRKNNPLPWDQGGLNQSKRRRNPLSMVFKSS
ncbi:hypothetical protein BU24DRAFT_231180 [Aaosphaeria arxii CBS 175.79]|uniref:Uncharacterized protein n=1 Tax=Aaosphaeria arxii CBS 175.79 TaxID=1450172 RepID=A0A6A5XJ36_9PLEO|nr:uncharacterized protein BU24DRAFT_231180 [Aaosphaeria arxii CBS 175.79]KAF2013142.1 hypothetical protein BU24DRAFT_231180 [Aaosphaeria arxii CBS 175.79]